MIAAVLLAVPAEGRAQARGWLARDKVLHFGASFGVASLGYAIGADLFECVPCRIGLGAGMALVAGGGKELADLAGLGDADLRDFLADLVGLALGVVLAWAIDVAVAGSVDLFAARRGAVHRALSARGGQGPPRPRPTP